MSEAVQASMDNNGNKDIATFNLNSQIPATLATTFELNLTRMIEKIDPYLIVLDIKNGEPTWLADSLTKIQKRINSDLIVCPTSSASSETLAAVKLIQLSGTESKAGSLGYQS